MHGAAHTRYVARWSLPMRLLHWGLAIAFLGLLTSGLALESPELRGIPLLGSKLVREVHLTWAVLLFALPATAAAWDDFRELRGVWREARHLDAADRRWLAALALRTVGRDAPLPEQGRLNAGQKLNLLIVVGLLGGLALSGAIIAPEAGRPVPQAIRALVYELHTRLAYATIPIVAGHVFLATVFPPTRGALRGMLLGAVRADWARAHHRRWLAEERSDQR